MVQSTLHDDFGKCSPACCLIDNKFNNKQKMSYILTAKQTLSKSISVNPLSVGKKNVNIRNERSCYSLLKEFVYPLFWSHLTVKLNVPVIPGKHQVAVWCHEGCHDIRFFPPRFSLPKEFTVTIYCNHDRHLKKMFSQIHLYFAYFVFCFLLLANESHYFTEQLQELKLWILWHKK